MWSSLFTLGLGAGGWWISKFLFEPLKEIYDLRRDVQECLIIHGDLSKDAPEDQRGAAATTFLHLGAGLVARDLAGLLVGAMVLRQGFGPRYLQRRRPANWHR
jgi:hypothetical protein